MLGLLASVLSGAALLVRFRHQTIFQHLDFTIYRSSVLRHGPRTGVVDACTAPAEPRLRLPPFAAAAPVPAPAPALRRARRIEPASAPRRAPRPRGARARAPLRDPRHRTEFEVGHRAGRADARRRPGRRRLRAGGPAALPPRRRPAAPWPARSGASVSALELYAEATVKTDQRTGSTPEPHKNAS